MIADMEKLKKEIEELEKQLEANPFGGLFDKNRMDQLYRKLKKRRKELARLEKSLAETAKEKPARKKAAAKKSAPAGRKSKKTGAG